MTPPESAAERTQELPRLDDVTDQDRREVEARVSLLGELIDLHGDDLPSPHADCVSRIYGAAMLWSGWGGARTERRHTIAIGAAELAELPQAGLRRAHVRVVEEALRLAGLVAEVVQPLGYTSQDRVV